MARNIRPEPYIGLLVKSNGMTAYGYNHAGYDSYFYHLILNKFGDYFVVYHFYVIHNNNDDTDFIKPSDISYRSTKSSVYSSMGGNLVVVNDIERDAVMDLMSKDVERIRKGEHLIRE